MSSVQSLLAEKSSFHVCKCFLMRCEENSFLLLVDLTLLALLLCHCSYMLYFQQPETSVWSPGEKQVEANLGGCAPTQSAPVTQGKFQTLLPFLFCKSGALFLSPFSLRVYFQKNYQKRKGAGLAVTEFWWTSKTSPWYLILHSGESLERSRAQGRRV